MSTIERILVEKVESLEKEIAKLKGDKKRAADCIWTAACVLQKIPGKSAEADEFFRLARENGA